MIYTAYYITGYNLWDVVKHESCFYTFLSLEDCDTNINPQIPHKPGKNKKPVTDWQLVTFQTDYDPYKNPWLM